MDGITSNQSTVLCTNKVDSLNKKGAFNGSGVSTLNTEPTGQVRGDSSDWLARPAGNSDMHARFQRSVGGKLFKSAKPDVVPEWIIKAVTHGTALAQDTGYHGEYTHNNISLAGVHD